MRWEPFLASFPSVPWRTYSKVVPVSLPKHSCNHCKSWEILEGITNESNLVVSGPGRQQLRCYVQYQEVLQSPLSII